MRKKKGMQKPDVKSKHGAQSMQRSDPGTPNHADPGGKKYLLRWGRFMLSWKGLFVVVEVAGLVMLFQSWYTQNEEENEWRDKEKHSLTLRNATLQLEVKATILEQSVALFMDSSRESSSMVNKYLWEYCTNFNGIKYNALQMLSLGVRDYPRIEDSIAVKKITTDLKRIELFHKEGRIDSLIELYDEYKRTGTPLLNDQIKAINTFDLTIRENIDEANKRFFWRYVIGTFLIGLALLLRYLRYFDIKASQKD